VINDHFPWTLQPLPNYSVPAHTNARACVYEMSARTIKRPQDEIKRRSVSTQTPKLCVDFGRQGGLVGGLGSGFRHKVAGTRF
jgi:hypothetical protein